MSVHVINTVDGAKRMRPVRSEEEYRALRDSEQNRAAGKRDMVQMNYSCLPNQDGTLKGAQQATGSVAMDIDFKPTDPDYAERMETTPEKVLAKKEELGLLMMERSAGKGFHIVFQRRPELTQEENLERAAELLEIPFDKGAKDITRVFFTPPTDHLLFLAPELFDNTPAAAPEKPQDAPAETAETAETAAETAETAAETALPPSYMGVPYARIVDKWWELYNGGQTPVESNRNTLTFELAVNLRHICGFDRQLLDRIIPCYDGFPEAEKLACIDSALNEKRTQMPRRLKDVMEALRGTGVDTFALDDHEGDDTAETEGDEAMNRYRQLPPLPQGIRESVDAVGPRLALPIITAVCPAVGMLATGVRLDIHGKKTALNLISYIAGDFASGKGSIDPVVAAWTEEVRRQDHLYQQQEEEWRARKRAAKNKKEQPEEPKLPVRCLTLNNTVANLAERLANTGGKHAFSFTPEADTVAQRWRTAMSDFSVMLRQAYDGSPYEREARSAEAVNVHIDRLLWNVVMCGTPDALYRVVTNCTDGFQSRIALARTPDNTFAPLDDAPSTLTEARLERIRQVAHLLPLMEGEVELKKLEEKGRQWLERVRLETMMDDDRVKARQRFRICPTTMRMMACLMLCRVAAQLITKHGVAGAERRLKENPQLWVSLIQKQQQPQLLEAFDVLADYQMDNALYFFRDRIETAFQSREYAGSGQGRAHGGKNDCIFNRLPPTFTREQAWQQAVVAKGNCATRNAVFQMLKNWSKQGLITPVPDNRYMKIRETT